MSDPGHRQFPTLDAMRAVGALLVVLTHCGFNSGQINHGWAGAALSRFDFGVTIFFVLSGFLLSMPILRARAIPRPDPSIRHYLWKRALRILPLYWVVVVVALLVDPLNNDAGSTTWITHLTLTQIYVPDQLASSLTQMWSLCTEVAFYLVLPVVVPMLAGRVMNLRRVLIGCGVLSGAGLAWAAFAGSTLGNHSSQWLPAYLPWFCVGIAFAACYCDPAAKARLDAAAADMAGWWILAGAIFAVACSDIAGPRLLIAPTAWEGFLKCLLYTAAGAALIFPLIFSDHLDNKVKRFLAGPVPSWFGEISYGVFAIHMFVLIQGMRLMGIKDFTGHFMLITSVTLTVSVALAALSYRFLERPILRLKNIGPFARMEPATKATATTLSP